MNRITGPTGRTRLVAAAATAAFALLLTNTLACGPREPAPPQEARAFDAMTAADSTADRVVDDTVQSEAVDVWVFRLAGLRTASVRLIATGDAGLSCRVYDPAGRQIDEGSGQPGGCERDWTPTTTGAYRVEVRNGTNQPVPYRLSIRH